MAICFTALKLSTVTFRWQDDEKKTGKEGWEGMGSGIRRRLNKWMTSSKPQCNHKIVSVLEWSHDLDNVIIVVLLKVLKIK